MTGPKHTRSQNRMAHWARFGSSRRAINSNSSLSVTFFTTLPDRSESRSSCAPQHLVKVAMRSIPSKESNRFSGDSPTSPPEVMSASTIKFTCPLLLMLTFYWVLSDKTGSSFTVVMCIFFYVIMASLKLFGWCEIYLLGKMRQIWSEMEHVTQFLYLYWGCQPYIYWISSDESMDSWSYYRAPRQHLN